MGTAGDHKGPPFQAPPPSPLREGILEQNYGNMLVSRNAVAAVFLTTYNGLRQNWISPIQTIL